MMSILTNFSVLPLSNFWSESFFNYLDSTIIEQLRIIDKREILALLIIELVKNTSDNEFLSEFF